MAGRHVDVEQHRGAAGVECAQLGDVFGGLPVGHLAVVDGGLGQHRRVGGRPEVVIGAVGPHPGVLVGLVRVAPLDVFLGGQRQRGVEHGVDHVDKRHLGDHGLEQVRPQVGDRAHQQAAGAAALDHELARLGVAAVHQALGAGDEVGEGVHLLGQLAVQIPLTAQVTAAADVGDREDHTAVQQRQPAAGEARVGRDAVAAVAVEQQRLRAGAALVLAVDQADRHAGAIRRRHPQPLAGVEAGVVAALHRLHLQQRQLAGGEVGLVGARRCGERVVGEAHARGVELALLGQRGAVGQLLEGDVARRATREREDAQLDRPAFTHLRHRVGLEGDRALHHRVRPVRDQLAPGLQVGRREHGPTARLHRQAQQPEVDAAVVDAQQQLAAEGRDVVFLAGAARQHLSPGAVGAVGRQHAPVLGVLGDGAQHQRAAIQRLGHHQVEELVRFFVHQHVRPRTAGLMAPELVGAPGLVVPDVEQRATVCRPDEAVRMRGGGDHAVLAAGDVAEVELEIARAGGVHAVGQQAVVRADGQAIQIDELARLGQLVHVHQQLLGRLRVVMAVRPGRGPTEEHRVLLAFQRAGGIPIGATALRHALVALLDAALHLLEEFVYRRLVGLEPGVGMGRFGLQMGLHLGVVLLAQPEVVVDAAVAMHAHVARLLGRGGRGHGIGRQGRGTGPHQCSGHGPQGQRTPRNPPGHTNRPHAGRRPRQPTPGQPRVCLLAMRKSRAFEPPCPPWTSNTSTKSATAWPTSQRAPTR
mmetsp:Transcript_53742/g.126652  ORF Transcript_53742/g.126652 Transcript_53742/m.126652 type:complete len:756 (-) Transcript_53742:2622-4889(-)